MSTATAEQIAALPKLEMHIHLEGTISPQRVARLASEQNIALPRPLDQLYETSDLGLFLDTLDWVCALFTEPGQLLMLAQDFAAYCQQQNIIYCELIVNPTHWSGLHYSELLPALSQAFDQVADLCDVRLLPSILRQQTAAEAVELVQWIGDSRNQPGTERLIGLSIDGNEAAAGRTGERFAEAYALAARLGLGRTCHAGESSGAEGVRDAVELLGAQRIDHGVRAIEDPELVQRLCSERITLNVCLSSNCHLIYDDISDHPLPALIEAGVPVTLNTDDPVVLKTTLNDELTWAAQALNFSIDDLRRFQRNAIASAFCDGATREALLLQLRG